MDPRSFDEETAGDGGGFGILQRPKRLVISVGDPHSGGETDPRPAPFDIMLGNIESSTVSVD